jgi:4-deoxy-L-threo-5-hexosulose-uronate ketol-isomerase
MKTRYTTDRVRYKTMTQQELRDAFLVSEIFTANQIKLHYCEEDRAIVGSAVPTAAPLKLTATEAMRADSFCERRELGILNIGAGGKISVDGTSYTMNELDCLYVGRGAKEVTFTSNNKENPAKFYLMSYPAHTSYPTTKASQNEAQTAEIGSRADANHRFIYRYIHPEGIKSCQLVMGFTTLSEGCVWNTMPPHTHERRSEVYMYFDMKPDTLLFHLMGTQDETRHIVVHNEQVVVSPIWSIHSGTGTRAYKFCWAMGGENQVFADMDHINVTDIR